MRFSILNLFIFLFSLNAYAYKIVIYTDQEDSLKASEVKDLFLKTYPFNQLEMDFEIKKVSAQELDCSSDPIADRLIVCKGVEKILKNARDAWGDQAFIVKDLNKYGGSGGSVPVISTDKKSDVRMMLHEYMHTLGFCDEYKYSKEEAKVYCESGGLNLAIIEPNSKGYSSDSEAKSIHSSQIPWFNQIKAETKITHDNERALGTDVVNSKVPSAINESNDPTTLGTPVGLYENDVCAEFEKKIHTWQPGGESSVMLYLSSGIGRANEELILKALLSRGAKLKPKVSAKDKLEINQSTRNEKVLINNELNQGPVVSPK